MTRPAYREVELDLLVTGREDSADGVVTLTLADPSRVIARLRDVLTEEAVAA